MLCTTKFLSLSKARPDVFCVRQPKKTSLTSPLLQLGVEALKERYLRHIIAPTRPQGERTLQLDIIRKDSTPSGQEELHTESLTVTVKEGAEEPVTTKPGLDM